MRLNRAALALLLATSTSLTIACSKAPSNSVSNLMAETTPETSDRVQETVIYGDDNRRDLYDEKDASLVALSGSTVALIKSSQIGANVGGSHAIQGEGYGKSYGLCTTERFFEQETAAFCSGFLISDTMIATAGHCVRSALDCSETSFVFDYAYKTQGVAPTSALADNVYRCKSVVHSEVASAGADFAIVELDRPVVNRVPVLMRQSGALNVGDDLTVIGHPAGLPTKIADGAKVRSSDATKGFFVANLDTYGGNSGSAVFNSATHEVEGILVRGETDFVWSSKGCSTSYVCKNDGCRGEDVTKISNVQKVLGSL